jgi:CubicO group peptidase (beta-lactamase class C family)
MLVSAASEPVPPDFERTVRTVMETWRMPGVSVAVVQNGTVAYAEGFGLREIGRDERVDADTIFGIASLTKLLVTTAVGVLIDEGKVELDRPVIEYLPDFRIADADTTRAVTLRDLLSHRSGIDFAGNGENVIEQLAGWESTEVVRRASYLPQQFPLRSSWDYNDFGFLVAAEVITAVSKQPWYEFIRRRIAEPLGLRSTWATSREFLPSTHVLPSGDGWSETISRGLATLPASINIAVPHLLWAGKEPQRAYPELTPRATTAHFHRSPIDPSQSAWSSARDLATFAAMWLNDGRHDGKQLLRRETVLQLNEWAVAVDPRWPLARDAALDNRSSWARAYEVGQAVGFAIFDYSGHMLAGHDGGELGYSTLLRMDRAKGLAVVVIVNNAVDSGGNYAKSAIAHTVLDWHYDFPATNRIPALFAQYEEQTRKSLQQYAEGKAAQDAGRNVRIKPSAPLGAYVGTYQHPFTGELRVELRSGNRLVATVGETAEWLLQPWRGDLFEAQWQGTMPRREFFRFDVSPAGHVKSIELVDESLRYERKVER